MCGIAGMIDLTDQRRQAPRGVVARMARAILHRGPDDDGYLDGAGHHLANRRLSIVGLKDGKQPIGDESGRIRVVFNGEFYDYPEKRAELEGRGHVFRTHTDTELIPHLWEEYGDRFWDHLKGQFALCLHDDRTNTFVLGRDRAGICPLFYAVAHHDGGPWLLFASEAKALFASGFVTATMNTQGINHIFTFFAMPGPLTVFEGVTLLPPGQYLQFTPGAGSPETLLTRKTYWKVNYPDEGSEEYGRDEKATVDGFEEVLYGAVERRLRADVPVVSYLSGGVDSSLIVAMACKALGRPIPTFTVGVTDGDGMNEESLALRTAKYLGCEPVIVKCGHDELRTGYPDLIRAAEFPVIDTACLGIQQLARSVRANGYKVALTGEGADEWLAGYPWFKIHRLIGWTDHVPLLPLGDLFRRAMARLNGVKPYPRQYVHAVQKMAGGQNAWLNVYGLMSFNKLRFFKPELMAELLPRSPYADLELNPDLHRWHPFHRQMYLGARIMLAGHLLSCKGDRVAMSHSVETRYPFLDEAVTDYMAKLHPRWKLRGLLRDKFIERAVARKWLPAETANRRKLMFRAPMDSWIQQNAGTNPAERWVDEVLSTESLKSTNLFDVDAVHAGRARLATMGRRSIGKTGLEMGLTAVVATQLWHHLYIRGGLCGLPTMQQDHAAILAEAA